MSFTNIMLMFVLIFLVIAFSFFCFRILKGPTAANKLLATDAATYMLCIMLAYLSVVYSEPLLIDVALLLAALPFIATILISKYIEGKAPWQ